MDPASLYALYLQHPVVCTDTRMIQPGCLFFALKGSQFDGNSFAAEALKQGAAYAIVSDSSLAGPKFIHTEDTLQTLQSLARFHRSQLHVPLVAITGSNGKTTTKELVTCALSEKYQTHATKGNLNNHIGVPLTLLGASVQTEIIVCEMGANHAGEIAMLCEIAMPTHGMITNIGKAHLEGFGSIEGVQKAKGELFDYLQMHGGLAFINVDDLRLRKLGELIPNRITYGLDPSGTPDIHFKYIPNQNNPGFTVEDINGPVRIHSNLFGDYNASNVLAAYVVGQHFNVPLEKLITSLSSFVSGSNRSEIISFKGCRIIKDAYNANPTSMELALRSFSQRFPEGWIILGDMKELGEESKSAHQYILGVVSELGFKHVVLVGTMFQTALQQQGGSFENVVTVNQIEEMKPIWNWEKCKDQTLLLKGSRSMSLEKILEF